MSVLDPKRTRRDTGGITQVDKTRVRASFVDHASAATQGRRPKKW